MKVTMTDRSLSLNHIMAGKVMGGGLGDEETKCAILLHELLHGHHSVHSMMTLSSQRFLCWPHIHLPSTVPCWMILQRLLPHHMTKPHQFIPLDSRHREKRFICAQLRLDEELCVHVHSFYAPCRCEIASTGTWSRMSAASFLTLSAMSMANTYTEYDWNNQRLNNFMLP